MPDLQLPPASGKQIAVQIVLAVVAIIILYMITLVVLNIDSLVISSSTRVKPRELTKIIEGYAPVNTLSNISINTVTPQASMFKKIGKSINTAGGAQFTYQMWMKVEEANDNLFKDLVILVKGDKRKYNVGYYQEMPTSTGRTTLKLVKTNPNQIAIACPMISFGKSYRSFKVRLNTNKNPMVDIDIAMNTSGGISNQNLLSLFAINSWYMFTFVVFDNFSIPQAAEDGIRFIMYVNDIPYVEHNAGTHPLLRNNSLKQNEGDLHLFPDNYRSGEFLKVGNVNYFNYALNATQVRKIFEQGPPNTPAMPIQQKGSQPSYISAYNKIDIYNY